MAIQGLMDTKKAWVWPGWPWWLVESSTKSILLQWQQEYLIIIDREASGDNVLGRVRPSADTLMAEPFDLRP